MSSAKRESRVGRRPGGQRSAELPEIVAALSGSIRELACELTGAKPSSRHAHHWRFGSKGSLTVVVDGAKRGAWFDHEAGQGGDALGLVAHLRRCPMREAYAWATRWLGMERRLVVADPEPEVRPAAPAASGTGEMARRLWQEAAQAAHSPVVTYLASRCRAMRRCASTPPVRAAPNGFPPCWR